MKWTSLNEFLGLLCESGVEYSQLKKTCPAELLIMR